MRNKLELSIELEKNKSVSLQESVDKLNQTLNDTNVSVYVAYYFQMTFPLVIVNFASFVPILNL